MPKTSKNNAAHWVFLADPTAYGWDNLVKEGEAVWDGIKNPIAQRRLGECKPDDEVLLYHTAPDKALMGTARVTKEPYPDPSNPGLIVLRIKPVAELKRHIPLAEIKADSILSEMGFVRMPRVAVHAVTQEQWDRVQELSAE